MLSSCLFGILSLLTACQNTENVTQEPVAETPLIISIDRGLSNEEFEQFVKTFSDLRGIDIQLETRSSSNVGENEIKTNLLTDNGADIILFSSGGLFKWLDPKQYFYDLSQEEFTSHYIPLYKKAVSIDNEVYGLPLGTAEAIGFFYQKDVYEQLNLNEPDNWASFSHNLEKSKQAGLVPILTPFKEQWLSQYYWYLGESLSENKEEGYKDILMKINDFKSKGYFTEEFLSTSLLEGVESFIKGESVHFLMQYGFIDYLLDTYLLKKENIGFFIPEAEQQNIHYMLPSSLYINKKSEHISLALEFFREYHRKMLNKLTTTIERPGVFDTDLYTPDSVIYEQTQDFKVDVLSDLMMEFFSGTLTQEEFLNQYRQREYELSLIY